VGIAKKDLIKSILSGLFSRDGCYVTRDHLPSILIEAEMAVPIGLAALEVRVESVVVEASMAVNQSPISTGLDRQEPAILDLSKPNGWRDQVATADPKVFCRSRRWL
jgi:hypothetical protein